MTMKKKMMMIKMMEEEKWKESINQLYVSETDSEVIYAEFKLKE